MSVIRVFLVLMISKRLYPLNNTPDRTNPINFVLSYRCIAFFVFDVISLNYFGQMVFSLNRFRSIYRRNCIDIYAIHVLRFQIKHEIFQVQRLISYICSDNFSLPNSLLQFFLLFLNDEKKCTTIVWLSLFTYTLRLITCVIMSYF